MAQPPNVSLRRSVQRGRRGTRLWAVTMPVAAAMGLAACASGDSTPTPPAPQVAFDQRLADKVPDAIAEDGLLEVGTDPSYPPMEMLTTDGTSVEGVDIDLATGIATILGLDPEFRSEAYTAIPTSVRSGRLELGMASLSMDPKEELDTNAVLYFEAGTQLVRRKAETDLTPQNMCGYRIATVEGAIQVAQLTTASRACREAGSQPIEITPASDQQAVTDLVVTGQAQGMVTDSPAATFAVAEFRRELAASGEPYRVLPYGALTSVEFKKFARAVRGAIQNMIDSGYYDAILDKWGVRDGAISKSKIRWATGD